MAANLMRVYREKIPIAMGTDAGNPLTLHGPSVYAEMEAMQKAGMPAMAVLVAATRGGADAMGRLVGFGTLEPGKGGDLLVLSADLASRCHQFAAPHLCGTRRRGTSRQPVRSAGKRLVAPSRSDSGGEPKWQFLPMIGSLIRPSRPLEVYQVAQELGLTGVDLAEAMPTGNRTPFE